MPKDRGFEAKDISKNGIGEGWLGESDGFLFLKARRGVPVITPAKAGIDPVFISWEDEINSRIIEGMFGLQIFVVIATQIQY